MSDTRERFEIIPLNSNFDAPNGPAAIQIEELFESDPERLKYFELLEEIKPHLVQGEVSVFGLHKERRLTCFYSTENCPMSYSGRTLTPVKPVKGGIIDVLFTLFEMPEMKEVFRTMIPGTPIELPTFNACFVNWFRPVAEIDTGKTDYLGMHSDDESSHKSSYILGVTYCEKNGERYMMLRLKNKTSGHTWLKELPHQSILLQCPGAQQVYKHGIMERKTNSKKQKVTGGRISLTFRSLHVPQ